MSGPRVASQALRRAGAAVLVGGLGLACALVVSACGSSSASSALTAPAATTSSATTTTTTTPTATTTAGGSFAAYQSCLQQHGVTLPQGGGFRRGGGAGRFGGFGPTGTTGAAGPTGTTGAAGPTGTPGRGRFTVSAAQRKALTACASLRPSGGFGGGGFGGGGGRGFNANDPAFAKFQACLQQHGVGTGGADRTSPAFQTALAACRSLLPAGGFGGAPGGGAPGGGGSSSANPAFARLQACLRQHGVQQGAAGQTAAKTQAAVAACRSVLPNGGSGAGSSAGTTTTG